MVNERAIAYSEVYAILNKMSPIYIEKIPKKLRTIIIEEMDKKYKPEIALDIPLEQQNLNEKTYTILAMINLNYWCDDSEHKKKLIKLYSKNDKVKEEAKRKKYNPDEIFENKSNSTEKLYLVEYKQTIVRKILERIKSWFK